MWQAYISVSDILNKYEIVSSLRRKKLLEGSQFSSLKFNHFLISHASTFPNTIEI